MLLDHKENPKRNFQGYKNLSALFFITFVFLAATPHVLDSIHTRYKASSTLTAEFFQTLKSKALGTTRESSGRIYIKRPDSFRWETLSEPRSILVGNGKKIWFYTPPPREGDRGQLIIRRAGDFQSKLAIDLLSGTIDFHKDFKIKHTEGERLTLQPLKPAGDLQEAEVFIDKHTNMIYKIRLVTLTGNETELRLKNVVFNPVLSTSMFNFSPPEGVPVEIEEIK